MTTIAQIARTLGIPESTARYYRDRFSGWIPTTGEGRSRRYPPAALDVIRAIAEMSRAGMPADLVEDELQRRGFALEAQPQTQQQVTATQQQTAAADLAALIRAAVAAEVAPLRDDLAAARNEIARLSALVEMQRRALAPPEPQPTAAEAQPPLSPLGRLRRLLGR